MPWGKRRVNDPTDLKRLQAVLREALTDEEAEALDRVITKLESYGYEVIVRGDH